MRRHVAQRAATPVNNVSPHMGGGPATDRGANAVKTGEVRFPGERVRAGASASGQGSGLMGWLRSGGTARGAGPERRSSTPTAGERLESPWRPPPAGEPTSARVPWYGGHIRAEGACERERVQKYGDTSAPRARGRARARERARRAQNPYRERRGRFLRSTRVRFEPPFRGGLTREVPFGPPGRMVIARAESQNI